MAERIIKIDDIDPSRLADATITFALGADTYEIDLCEENSQDLRDALEPFIAVARIVQTPVRRARGTVSTSTRDTAAIRAWGRANGYKVPERGRLNKDLIAAYDAAHAS